MIRGMKPNGCDEFETPDWLFNALNERFNFNFDAACNLDNCKVDISQFGTILTPLFRDGLTHSLSNKRVFCNPPYSQKFKWIEKAKTEVQNGCPVCVMILPCTMEVLREIKGFHYDVLPRRVNFIDPNTKKPSKGNNQGTVVVCFWSEIRQ